MKVFALVLLAAAVVHAGEIHPALKARLARGEVLDVMIQLPEMHDIFENPQLLGLKNKEARTATMVSMLKERTAASRRPFVNILTELGQANQKSVKDPIWISNRFEVKNVDAALAEVLARVPGDFIIREPKVAHIGPVETRPVSIQEVQQNEYQWGVDLIDAPRAWQHHNGTNVIVAIIDTGVHLAHEALAGSYAGAWRDPYYNRPEPNDIQSHGTHCIGSVLGTTRGIGVAPGAKWIACRGLNDQGSGSEANLLDCAQWVLDGADPKPHVCTNSWGGGSNDAWYNEAMRAWIVGNIIPVFALGNSGPSCSSNNSPGDSVYALGCGATNSNDQVASFSSRGPARAMLKPEVSAPGQDIISAGNTGNTYTSKSGTSMATPHVAGVVALLLEKNPDLNFNQIKAILQGNGDYPPVTNADLNCGEAGSPENPQYPNNAFGHARVNALKVVTHDMENKVYF